MQEASRLGRGGQGLLELLLHLPQGLGVRGELAETQAQGLGEAGTGSYYLIFIEFLFGVIKMF